MINSYSVGDKEMSVYKHHPDNSRNSHQSQIQELKRRVSLLESKVMSLTKTISSENIQPIITQKPILTEDQKKIIAFLEKISPRKVTAADIAKKNFLFGRGGGKMYTNSVRNALLQGMPPAQIELIDSRLRTAISSGKRLFWTISQKK